jgi:hypothetical protein
MRYRWVYLLASLGVLLGLAGLGVFLVRREPDWYAEAAQPPGPQRQANSRRFATGFYQMLAGISGGSEWGGDFTNQDINAYLEEDFVQSGLAAQVLPEGISEPRCVFEPNRIRLAFRYGGAAFNTVVSIDLRPWLAKHEPNVLCLELEAFHLGALPLSVQSILEHISEMGRQYGIDISWYRNPETGKPVAVLRFQADKPHPTLELSSIYLGQGQLTIRGKSNDTAPRSEPSPASQPAPSAPSSPSPQVPAQPSPTAPGPRPN